MIILVGPSASGKSVVAKYLTNELGYKKFVTSTTRPIRVGEINGIDYNFLTIDTFNKKIDNNEFIEHTFYNGNFYGTEKKLVDDDTVLIVETEGLKEFKKLNLKNVFSYFLIVDEETRIKRMEERGDDSSLISKRVNHDHIKFKETNYENYIDKYIDCNNKTIEKIAREISSDYKDKIIK